MSETAHGTTRELDGPTARGPGRGLGHLSRIDTGGAKLRARAAVGSRESSTSEQFVGIPDRAGGVGSSRGGDDTGRNGCKARADPSRRSADRYGSRAYSKARLRLFGNPSMLGDRAGVRGFSETNKRAATGWGPARESLALSVGPAVARIVRRTSHHSPNVAPARRARPGSARMFPKHGFVLGGCRLAGLLKRLFRDLQSLQLHRIRFEHLRRTDPTCH